MNWTETAVQILLGAAVFAMYHVHGFELAVIVALVQILIVLVGIVTQLTPGDSE